MEMNDNNTAGTGGSTGTGGGTDTQHGHPLPCGRTVEQVWQDMETGNPPADGHPSDCPHCATARAGLEQLAEATRLLVDDPVEAPVGLLDKVMAAVRADLAHADVVALPAPTPPGGTVDISTYALAAMLRYAVDTVTGVRAHRCRVETDPDHAADPDSAADPYAVRVWMSVSLHYGTGHLAALDHARARVAAALTDRIGLRLAGLDIEVVDVWTDPPPADDATTGAETS